MTWMDAREAWSIVTALPPFPEEDFLALEALELVSVFFLSCPSATRTPPGTTRGLVRSDESFQESTIPNSSEKMELFGIVIPIDTRTTALGAERIPVL